MWGPLNPFKLVNHFDIYKLNRLSLVVAKTECGAKKRGYFYESVGGVFYSIDNQDGEDQRRELPIQSTSQPQNNCKGELK